MPHYNISCLESHRLAVTYQGIEADSLPAAFQEILDGNTAVAIRMEYIERISPFDLDAVQVDQDGKRLNLSEQILNPLLPIEEPLLTLESR